MKFLPEDQRLVEPLAAFILSFVQALLKTGYYQADHPGSTAAKRGLYQEWVRLGQADREISFVVADQEEGTEILIYGILLEVTPLKKLFSPNMAELFLPKLRQYFERRHLMSFTLKPGITLEEFEGFVDIMTELPTSSDMQQTIAEMTEKLVSRRIVHVSAVYLEEVLLGERSLHWMTRIVLTRLNKDLRMIPLYRHLTQGQMVEVKVRVFREILRPLSSPVVLKEVLIHCDLILLPDSMDPMDISEELTRHLSVDYVWGVLLECTRDLKAVSPRLHPDIAEEASALYQRLLVVIKKLVPNLLDEAREGSEEAIEILLQEGAVTLDVLPEKLIGHLMMKRKMEDYLQHKERYWDLLCEGDRKGEVQSLSAILVLLLRRDNFVAFGELLGQFHGVFRKRVVSDPAVSFTSMPEIAGVREMIVSKLQARRLVRRKELFAVLEPLADSLYEYLIPLCAHEDLWLRRNICRILARVGESVIPGLLALAREPKQGWQVVRNVVMILGDIGSVSDPALSFLRRCQQHPQMRVREEVISSYGKMRGEKVEMFLLQELENPDLALRGRAVLALSHSNPVPGRYLAFLRDTLRKKKKNELEAEESLQVNCCLAIESIATFNPQVAQSFEPILYDVLTKGKSFLFGLVGEKYHEKGYEVRKAICRLLGVIGDKRALPLLAALLEEKPWLPEDKTLLQQAIQRIERREARPEADGPASLGR